MMDFLPQASIRREVKILIRGEIEAVFITFHNLLDKKEHFAIKLGDPNVNNVLVRVHSECITGDLFGSLRCDCGEQLKESIGVLSDSGGYIIYMRQEGRGIGLFSKLDAYQLQDEGLDTFEANLALSYPEDARDYKPAAQIIQSLGLKSIRLLTNNNAKAQALINAGICVIEQVPTGVFQSAQNLKYLYAKRIKHGHNIQLSSSSKLNG